MDIPHTVARFRSPDIQLPLPETGVAEIRTSRCVVCNRRLKHAPWVDMGIGSTCAKKHTDLAEQLRLAARNTNGGQRDENRLSKLPVDC